MSFVARLGDVLDQTWTCFFIRLVKVHKQNVVYLKVINRDQKRPSILMVH